MRTGFEHHTCGNMTLNRRDWAMDEVRGYLKQSLCLLREEILATFCEFTGFVLNGAVNLLALCNSPLLIKSHGAILWQAVKFLFKLLLQFPKADK